MNLASVMLKHRTGFQTRRWLHGLSSFTAPGCMVAVQACSQLKSHPTCITAEPVYRKPRLLCATSGLGGSSNGILSRTFSSRLLKILKKISSEVIQKKDNLSSHYELVYTTSMVPYLQLGLAGVHIVGATVLGTLCAAALGVQLPNIGLLYLYPVESFIFIFVNAILCLGVLKVVAYHPIRIYYSEEDNHFMAVFMGKHPFSVRMLCIQPGEVKPVISTRLAKTLIPWHSNVFTTASHKIHLNEVHFKYPVYYNKLLGYDKV